MRVGVVQLGAAVRGVGVAAGGAERVPGDHQEPRVQQREPPQNQHGQHPRAPWPIPARHQVVPHGAGPGAQRAQGPPPQDHAQHRPGLRQNGTVPGRLPQLRVHHAGKAQLQSRYK